MQDNPNLSYIKELSEDDSVFEQKFIKILKEEFPLELQTYVDHIHSKETDMAAEVVHKLKHKFNILSMSNAYTFAVHHEEALRKGSMKMDVDFLEILGTVKNYLKTI